MGELSTWARVRRFAVPRPMIERATAAREAGDWRLACEVSHVDVDLDLPAVARQYGADLAARLVDDLNHLAPDLVRWHLPRVDDPQRFHNGVLDPKRTCVLASYGDPAIDGPFLMVETPETVYSRQWLRLRWGPLPRANKAGRIWWTGLRHLWDARHSDQMRLHAGGSCERAPFVTADGTPHPFDPGDIRPADMASRTEAVAMLLSHGRYQQRYFSDALRVAGIHVIGEMPYDRWGWVGPARGTHSSSMGQIALTQWPPALTALRPVSDAWLLPLRSDGHTFGDGIVLTGRRGGKPTMRYVSRVSTGQEAQLPVFPEAAAFPPPDLDLLVAGDLTTEDLHPLVRAALFPARPAADRPVGPPDPAPPRPVKVRCGATMHEVIPAGNGLATPSHTAEEVARQMAITALGESAPIGCVAALHAWATGSSTVNAGLKRQRLELFARVMHGDTDGVLAMLDAGFDIAVRDTGGRTLLYHLHRVDHERLLPRLLAAGLDITGRDHYGRTPLQFIAKQGAGAALLRAVIEAGGADTTDAWDWVKPSIIKRFQRTDPELAERLRGHTDRNLQEAE